MLFNASIVCECLRNQREIAENALSEFHAREVEPIAIVLSFEPACEHVFFGAHERRSVRRTMLMLNRRWCALLERNRWNGAANAPRVPHWLFIGVIGLIVGDRFITSAGWFWCQAMSNGRESSSICPADRNRVDAGYISESDPATCVPNERSVSNFGVRNARDSLNRDYRHDLKRCIKISMQHPCLFCYMKDMNISPSKTLLGEWILSLSI